MIFYTLQKVSKHKKCMRCYFYLVALLDEVDIASQVDSEPDDCTDSGVHALAVATAGKDGDALAAVGVATNQPTPHLVRNPSALVTSKCP